MGEQVRIGDTLETVKEGMAQMRAQLENLSRAIWQDIDHEDAAALEAGVRFKQRYNERRSALDQAMTDQDGFAWGLEHTPLRYRALVDLH